LIRVRNRFMHKT